MVTEIKSFPQVRQSDNEVEAYQVEVPIEYVNIELVPAMPKELLLGSLRDGRLRVISPLHVQFKYEGNNTIAEAIELDEFGFGKNVSEAIADLQRSIAELYFTLEKEQGRLGIDLQRIWNVLQEKILQR